MCPSRASVRKEVDTMKRLGLFTGKIYEDGYDAALIEECCLCLSDKQAEDAAFVEQMRTKSSEKCARCMGCPASQTN